MSVYKTVYFI